MSVPMGYLSGLPVLHQCIKWLKPLRDDPDDPQFVR
jgi:hypothetical protein